MGEIESEVCFFTLFGVKFIRKDQDLGSTSLRERRIQRDPQQFRR